ncbi:MAG: ribonuclease III, partial [Eggerthella lenta]
AKSTLARLGEFFGLGVDGEARAEKAEAAKQAKAEKAAARAEEKARKKSERERAKQRKQG